MDSEYSFPKSILILNKVKARSLQWEESYDLDEDVQILSLEEVKTLPFKFEESPKINQIYIQHPFSNEIYLKPNIDGVDIQILKLNYLSQLSAILGAKNFKTTLINREETNKKKVGELIIDVPLGGSQIGSENSSGHTVASFFEMENKYDGNIPQHKNACDYAIKTGLSKDKLVWALIERRNPEHGNLVNEETITVNLSKEINEFFDLAAALNAFAGKVNLKVKYSFKEMKKEIVELTVKIQF
jgi:hypothetical protein